MKCDARARCGGDRVELAKVADNPLWTVADVAASFHAHRITIYRMAMKGGAAGFNNWLIANRCRAGVIVVVFRICGTDLGSEVEYGATPLEFLASRFE